MRIIAYGVAIVVGNASGIEFFLAFTKCYIIFDDGAAMRICGII